VLLGLGAYCLNVLWCCRLATANTPILLPQNGPLIIGATSEQDADVLIDEPRVSGRHARIEIVPCDGGSKCNQDYRLVSFKLSYAFSGPRCESLIILHTLTVAGKIHSLTICPDYVHHDHSTGRPQVVALCLTVYMSLCRCL